MHRRTAFGGNVCEAAKETSNSAITALNALGAQVQTCHQNTLNFLQSQTEALNEQEDAHVTRMLDDELT